MAGQFPNGNLQEFFSKSIGKWSGTPLINSHLETLRDSLQTLWKGGLGRTW